MGDFYPSGDWQKLLLGFTSLRTISEGGWFTCKNPVKTYLYHLKLSVYMFLIRFYKSVFICSKKTDFASGSRGRIIILAALLLTHLAQKSFYWRQSACSWLKKKKKRHKGNWDDRMWASKSTVLPVRRVLAGEAKSSKIALYAYFNFEWGKT